MQHPLAELQRRGQGTGAGRAQAAQLPQFLRRPFQQRAQAAFGGEQFARRGHRIAAAQSRAEKNCHQFGVRQRTGTAGQQFLAGTFVGGPVADVHAFVGRWKKKEVPGRGGGSKARLRTWTGDLQVDRRIREEHSLARPPRRADQAGPRLRVS